uniref:Uncharacterized protein n=1 Tax=Glossina brevipalpis TaxID=37001 RepID=A0A1A9WNS3_9MUSC
MYEISPYATFSVNGGRTGAPAKASTRGMAASPLDYTMQFKTFGHPEGENLNATAYPLLPSSGFGHIKSKSSWHKQRYYNTDDDSTLSKSLTLVAGSQMGHPKKSGRSDGGRNNSKSAGGTTGTVSSSAGAGVGVGHCESESDTSISPSTEFSNMPTYRVPCKSSRNSDGRSGVDMFRPDSSTESNNDQSSPVERRANTQRFTGSSGASGGKDNNTTSSSSSSADKRMHPRNRKHQAAQQQQSQITVKDSLERRLRSGSNNSLNSDINNSETSASIAATIAAMTGVNGTMGFRPPTGFMDSREFSEAECDHEQRALDLEVQRVMENTDGQFSKVDREELSSLLARYHEKKEQERQEFTIHV